PTSSTLFPYTTLFRSDTHIEITVAASAVDGHLSLRQPLTAETCGREEIHQLRHHLAQRMSQHLRLGDAGAGGSLHGRTFRQSAADRNSARLNSSHRPI